MIIKYKKISAYINLLLGFMIMVSSIFNTLQDNHLWFAYIQGILGFLLVIISGFQIFYQKLIIENGVLKQIDLPKKEIKLTEVTKILSSAGKITISTPTKKISIGCDQIQKKSLSELLRVLGALEFSEQKNPLVHHSQKLT